jgi:hypothetical protein
MNHEDKKFKKEDADVDNMALLRPLSTRQGDATSACNLRVTVRCNIEQSNKKTLTWRRAGSNAFTLLSADISIVQMRGSIARNFP